MNEELETTRKNEGRTTDYMWLASCALVTAVATFVRFFWLELKPLHHDEGVNGYFLTTLFREGKYTYDPANYHGPDLYYISLAFTKIFDLNTLSVRWSVAIFGVLTVVLAFYLRRYIGKTGSIFAAFFLALSPGMTYISRYFIHEILFVFFSFGIVVAILFFIERRKAGIGAIAWTSLLLLICFLPSALNLANVLGGENTTLLWTLRVVFFLVEAVLVFFVMRMLLGWNDGYPIYLLLASASTVLLFATKETAFITIGTMVIAAVCVFHWRTLILVETPIPVLYYRAVIIFLLIQAGINFLFIKNTIVYIGIGALLAVYVGSWIFGALWRKYNTPESAQKNLFRIYTALSVLTITGVLLSIFLERGQVYKSSEKFSVYQGLRTIRDNFAGANSETVMSVFYSILALAAVGTIAWFAFLFLNRDRTETALNDDDELNWTHFREKMTASDTWEFVAVKAAITGAVIALVWLFVRYAIDLLTAWKADKTFASALNKIDLGKVDFWILAIAVVCLVIAGIAWIKKKPEKVSIDLVLMIVAAFIVFLYVGALFFSSFFTYPEGLRGAFEAYAIWTKTGNTDHTQNGFWAYVRWGMIIEAPLIILSALGTLIAFYKSRHRFAMFAGLWAFGLFAAYTIIPYKTPWLALSFLLPMCIVAGYAVNELLNSRQIIEKAAGVGLTALGTIILAYQTYDINFVRYDDDRMPYIYAHTKREFLDLIRKIEYYADKSGQGKQTKIEIVSPDYWSMPWYLNDYPNAVFHGKPADISASEIIVAKKDEQDAEIVSRYASRYRYAGEFPLRPGVDLILLVRRDLADSDTKDIYSVFGEPFTITPDNEIDADAPTPTR